MRTSASDRRRLCALLVAGLWLLLATSAHGAEKLPDKALVLFDGGTLQLGALTSRVVVLRFAASW